MPVSADATSPVASSDAATLPVFQVAHCSRCSVSVSRTARAVLYP